MNPVHTPGGDEACGRRRAEFVNLAGLVSPQTEGGALTMALTRRDFLRTGTALCGLTLARTAYPAGDSTKTSSNILLILVDDMGWTGPACYGSDLHETPRIDQLAAQGVRFTDAYSASPVCTPTRASIQTGRHPARLNMTTWHEDAVSRQAAPGRRPLAPPLTEANLDLSYTTLAEVLRDRGYRTAHVGKWHLGDAAHYPETQGYELNIGGTMWGAPATYWSPYHAESVSDGAREHRYVPGLPFSAEGEYLTDRLTTEAIRVLERIKDGPFLLSMCYHSPHTPIEAKPEIIARYTAKVRPGMRHTNARYAAMVHSLDENVGRLLDALDRLDVAHNTMVVFHSDNGGFDQVRDGEQVTNNTPLRSGKGSLYEGGIRVPLIVRLPGTAPEGAVCDTPVVSTDLYPTLLRAAGVADPAAGAGGLDGADLTPALQDPRQALARESICWHHPHYYFTTTPVGAIREGRWKLLEYFEDGRTELYDLHNDVGEAHNVAVQYPEKAAELLDHLLAWRGTVRARMPEPNA